MKTHQMKKLKLNRETLKQLEDENLAGAIVGQAPTATQGCSYCVSCASFCHQNCPP